MRPKNWEIELKVGVFVSAGVILLMVAILLIGGQQSFLSRTSNYNVFFKGVDGLVTGAKVAIGGLQVGTVNSVDFDAKSREVKVELKIEQKYQEYIREDSRVEISTQGMLGDKYITVSAGSPESKIVEEGATLERQSGAADLGRFLSRSDELMGTLNNVTGSLDRILRTFEANKRAETIFSSLATTSKNLSETSAKLSQEMNQMKLKDTMNQMHAILEKINNGTGTIGALINDPGLYYDARALMGGANRNRIVRNLVRKTVQEGEQK